MISMSSCVVVSGTVDLRLGAGVGSTSLSESSDSIREGMSS